MDENVMPDNEKEENTEAAGEVSQDVLSAGEGEQTSDYLPDNVKENSQDALPIGETEQTSDYLADSVKENSWDALSAGGTDDTTDDIGDEDGLVSGELCTATCLEDDFEQEDSEKPVLKDSAKEGQDSWSNGNAAAKIKTTDFDIREYFNVNAYEGFVISAIGAILLSYFFRGGFSDITSLSFSFENKLVSAAAFVMLFLLLTLVYYKKSRAARLIFFGIVTVFSMTAAYVTSDVDWTAFGNNPIGGVCFFAVLSGITVLTYFYIKDDVHSLFDRIEISDRTMKIIAFVMGVLIFIAVAVIGVLRYTTYSSNAFDFGVWVQMYRSMFTTGAMTTVVERSAQVSHLAIHFSPILYVGLPLYFIFPRPETIQIIQAIMIALPVIPLVLLGKKFKLDNKLIIGIVLLYALYPATVGGIMYDMHENCFLVFLILMAIWAAEKNKNITVVIFCALTCLVKEDAPLYIAVLGLYYIVSKRHRKMGLAMLACGLIAFGAELYLVQSLGVWSFDDRFSNLTDGGSIFEIIMVLLGNPEYVLTQAVANVPSSSISMDKIGYYIVMFVPVAAALFSTKRHYARYILMAPLIVMNCITVYYYMHNINYQYNFGSIALIMFIIMMNLSDMSPKKAGVRVTACVLCALMMFTGTVSWSIPYYVSKYNENKETYDVIEEALNYVPDDAVVSADSHFVAHLYRNTSVYSQSALYYGSDSEDESDEDAGLTAGLGVVSDSYQNSDDTQDDFDYSILEYLVVDERYEERAEQFDDLLNTGEFEQVYSSSGIISVYRRIGIE